MDHTRNWLKQNPEKFPVVSWLLPAPLHEHLWALYDFVYGAKELASAKKTSAAEQQASLQQLEAPLVRGEYDALPSFAQPLAVILPRYPALLSHMRILLLALQQDIHQRRYRNYPELKGYYEHSAVPLGRMIATVCDELSADMTALDAFSHAVLLLHHICNCAKYYNLHDRIYLPLDWFTFASATTDMLGAKNCTPALRKVIERGLDQADRLLMQAKPLLPSLRQRALRTHAAWMYARAEYLSRLLRKQDPLTKKTHIGYFASVTCFVRALCM